MIATSLAVAWTVLSVLKLQATASTDAAEIMRLEAVWNEAHLRGDVPVLEALCSDELVVTVPSMKLMTKADILGFWQSGRAKITTYDTSDLRVVIRGDTAIATGRLKRTRDFNGTVMTDLWQYTKTYVRSDRGWVVMAYHASDAPK